MYLLYGKTIYYKYGASCDLARQCRANNAVMWKAIQWGCENGYEVMDLGRFEVEHEGLRRFKGDWGTEETILPYYYWWNDGSDTGSSDKFLMKIAKNLFSKMPLGLLQFTGNRIYKYAA